MKNFFYYVVFTVLMIPALTGCANAELGSTVYKTLPNGSPVHQGTFKIGNPYKAEGRWYRPQETYSHSEVGVASWYGAEFNGRKTANGEIFNKNELTAAHRTLQMPSLIRVTNLNNNKSVVVRVNDRGPFARDRILDVSQRAAQELGFIGHGTAKVRIDLLAEESKNLAEMAKRGYNTRGSELAHNNVVSQQAAQRHYDQIAVQQPQYQQASLTMPSAEGSPSLTGLYVQAGSFSDQAHAESLASELSNFGSVGVYQAALNGRSMYRVRLGPFEGVDKANDVLAQIGNAGHRQAMIVVD